jgi:hypothetical protein
MFELSDSSAALLQQISEEHELCEQSLKRALKHASEAGRLLLQAKDINPEKMLRLGDIPTHVYMEAYRRTMASTVRWQYTPFAYLLIQLAKIQRMREAWDRPRGEDDVSGSRDCQW